MTKKVDYRPSPEQELCNYGENLRLWLSEIEGVGHHNLQDALIMLGCLNDDMKRSSSPFGGVVAEGVYFEAERY